MEGGFDEPYQPATCFRPTIALGRHAGPGDADGLWRDYERVLDLVPTLGFDGVRLSVEWARIEPRRDQVDDAALERYADVARYARDLGLGVTVVIVDAAWPAWLGLEAWLLPWVVPRVLEQARRVVGSIPAASGAVVFAHPESLVKGYLDASGPPWRKGARVDAAMAEQQIASIVTLLREDPLVGPKIIDSTCSVSVGSDLSTIKARFESDCDQVYVRSLLGGHGPSKCAGLLLKSAQGWRLPTSAALLEVLR